ncbi:hypothetical protein SBDP1_940009 [Syntrophobacter sp. SbD1]|nr:hypothetical protein SBDP1_940009 [Syntrophobacter sp. SbD1]
MSFSEIETLLRQSAQADFFDFFVKVRKTKVRRDIARLRRWLPVIKVSQYIV